MDQSKDSNWIPFDIDDLVRLLKNGRTFILKVTISCAIVGLGFSFLLRNEYMVQTRILPESNATMQSGLGGLGGLAGLAGINLNFGSESQISPDLYPQIVSSIPFLLELMSTSIYFESNDTTLSVENYFATVLQPTVIERFEDYTLGLPSKIKKYYSNNSNQYQHLGKTDLLRLSEEEQKIVESLNERIVVNSDITTGVVVIGVTLPDPYASAKLAEIIVDRLTAQISEFKVEKVRAKLKFIKERHDESKKTYIVLRDELAKKTDKNKNINTATAELELKGIQEEYNIAYEVYKSLATQLEQAKLKVKESTPIFTIIEPPKVPLQKTFPQRKLIVVVSVFIGLLLSSVILFTREYLL